MGNIGVEAVATADGSWTLRDLALDETFHSKNGAVTESETVFVVAGGARSRAQSGLSTAILEIGLGTGLNFLLTATEFLAAKTRLTYSAIDCRWLPPSLLAPVFAAVPGLSQPLVEAYLNAMAHADETVGLSYGLISLKVNFADADKATWPGESFDICYLDAFSPAKAAPLWAPEFLARLHAALRPGGQLVTYCAQGHFRRSLAGIGFAVNRLPGPPGKRHITRARKV